MIIVKSITRRAYLNLLFASGILLILRPFQAWSKLGESSRNRIITTHFANLFINKQSAAIIGREYLRIKPNESDSDLLIDLICSFQREQYLEIAKRDKKELRKLLLLKQRFDFEQGRIVNIRGWILSETEARLCALAALV